MEGSNTPVCTASRICVGALGLSIGLLSAIWVALLGFAAMYFNVGHEWVKLAGTIYVGYAVTFKGIFIGALWAFIDGFICGALIAFFYNLCVKCCKCCKCCSCGKDVKVEVKPNA